MNVHVYKQIAECVRPQLDRSLPLNSRCQALWAAAKNARGATDDGKLAAAFTQLADNTGLIADLNTWGRSRGLKQHGEQTVRHLIGWALRGMNPFETGPLQ